MHHGVEKPDTADNLRKQLVEFRDFLDKEHKCLSLMKGNETSQYAFVRGNLALDILVVENFAELIRKCKCLQK